MVHKFLSIDWDYFIDATSFQRGLLFPDGGNELLSHFLQNTIWSNCYRCPELKEVGVVEDEYEEMKEYLQSLTDLGEVMIADSHRFMYSHVLSRKFTSGDKVLIYLVDFHHDFYNYHTGSMPVNCGNWVTKLQSYLEKSGIDFEVKWVCREDSEKSSLQVDDVFSKCTIEEVVHDRDIKYVYMCRSSMWSPPHLDTYFEELCKCVTDRNSFYTKGDLYDRGGVRPWIW